LSEKYGFSRISGAEVGGGDMLYHKREYFVCIIPQKNKFAFYELIAARDLFGFIVVRHWGRIGTKGQPAKQQRFADEHGMMKEFDRVYRERIGHKYIPVQHRSGAGEGRAHRSRSAGISVSVC